MSQLPMVDVSSNNHTDDAPIDWAKVHGAGVRAVMIKASEGTAYSNPWVAEDGHGAARAGLLVGYYHFARPSVETAEAQAAHAISTIMLLPRDLGLALDLEVAEGAPWGLLATWARAFHAAARKVVNHSPLYTNDSFLANLPGAPWGERLWLAQTARPRRQVWAWQTTTPQAVNGITGPVDVGWLHPDAA